MLGLRLSHVSTMDPGSRCWPPDRDSRVWPLESALAPQTDVHSNNRCISYTSNLEPNIINAFVVKWCYNKRNDWWLYDEETSAKCWFSKISTYSFLSRTINCIIWTNLQRIHCCCELDLDIYSKIYKLCLSHLYTFPWRDYVLALL